MDIPRLTAAGLELARVLAGAIECDISGCPPARCHCRAQAAEVMQRYRIAVREERPSKSGWTADRKQVLKTLFYKVPVVSYEEMGAQLEVSRWQIKGQLEKMGLRRRDWGPGKPRIKPAIAAAPLPQVRGRAGGLRR